jgi:hypothetical protein
MLKFIRVSVSLLFQLFATLIPISGFGGDFGTPDTVKITCDSLIVGRSMPVSLTFVNDDNIEMYGCGLVFNSLDGGFAKFDSMVFVNRMSDPTVLNVRWVIPKSSDGISPDSLQHDSYEILANTLGPGNTVVAHIYMTGVSSGSMKIDSSFIPPGSIFVIVPQGSQYFVPQFVSATIPIVEGNSLPEITTSENWISSDASSAFEFDVVASSPEGFPVSVALVDFGEFDNPTNSPTNAPSFTYNSGSGVYEFSWGSTANDIGVWRATLSACDSSGGCVSSEVVVQVVESAGYIVSLNSTESPGFSFPTAVGFGDFDGDLFPEIASSGLGYLNFKYFNLYENDGSGSFLEVFNSQSPQVHRRGLEVGYLDSDEQLDIVQFYHEGSSVTGILAYTGDGNNNFATPVTSSMPGDWSVVAAVGKFNNDEFLDYAVGGLNSVRIFTGSSTLAFTMANQLMLADSVMTLTSADFNGDGFDDLAIGNRQGLSIHNCNGNSGFSLSASYSQTYGSANIEVTNQGSDFNGDNYFDLCIATPSVGDTTSQLVVYLGNGDGTFEQRVTRTIYGQIAANAPGDFNNDGNVDIAFVNSALNYLGILFGDGDGYFTNELRYPVPKFDPYRLIATDADVDGDVDVLVASYRIPDGSSLYLFDNQTNPGGFEASAVDFSGEDNASLELVSPTGKVLNRVGSSMPSASYYRRNLNLNNKLDDFAQMSLAENGEYLLSVRPDLSQPAGTPFTVEFKIDGVFHRLAKEAVMNAAEYEFGVNIGTNMSVAPRPGSFVQSNPPAFAWMSKANVDFQLASDLDFSAVIVNVTVSGGLYQPATPLTAADSSTFYWRIKPTGTAEYGPIYAFNLLGSGSSCGDIDGLAGDLNILDLTYLVNLIFRGGPMPPDFGNADLNNDGLNNILDLTFLVDFLFRGGAAPVCE